MQSGTTRKKSPGTRKLDLRPYAGRWVALVQGRVAGTGLTAQEARTAAKLARPKEDPVLRFVPEEHRPTYRQARSKLQEATLSTLMERLAAEELVQVTAHVCAERGAAVYVVGGAVRDMLLGHAIHDWDFVVERDAIRLARATADRLGADFFALDQGRDTGRVIFHNADGTRTFLDFAARRGPDWQADLEARDFTVNAMALPLDGRDELLDPFNGRADLAARLIRAVTEHSFRDDSVRMMRAVRQASELGFEIEPQTADWIRRDAASASRPSAERIRDELAKLLARPNALASVRKLDELGLLPHVLPEVSALRGVEQSLPHHWPVLEHTLFALGALERIVSIATRRDDVLSYENAPEFVWGDVKRLLADFREPLAAHLAQLLGDDRPALVACKLAALLHDCGKPQTRTVGEDGRTHFYDHENLGALLAAERVRALRFTNTEVERVRVIIVEHMRPQQVADAPGGVTRRAAYRFFRATGEAGIEVMLLALADHIATHGPDVQPDRWDGRITTARELLADYWARLAKGVAATPLLSGDDLMAELELSPGKRVGELLEAIREAQAAGEVATREEALARVRTLLGRMHT